MISLNWVGDYIDIKDQDVHELATKITKAGINIEGVYTHHIDNLVIGQIKRFKIILIVIIYIFAKLILVMKLKILFAEHQMFVRV